MLWMIQQKVPTLLKLCPGEATASFRRLWQIRSTLSGTELHVDAVMEGSVLRSGNRVRIAAHVIYAPTDQSLMAATYEDDLGDVLKLQREVAESITEKIRARLTPEQQSRLHEGQKVDSEAYEAYLMATYPNLGLYQGNEKARSYVQKAIQKDPNFASAYGLLAWTYIYPGELRWRSPQEVYDPLRSIDLRCCFTSGIEGTADTFRPSQCCPSPELRAPLK
jgi:hypothetical protein